MKYTSLIALSTLASILVLAGCKRPGAPVDFGTYDLPPQTVPADLPLRYQLVGTLEPHLAELKGIALGPDGRLYAAGREGVRVLDVDGKTLATWPTPSPAHCVALAADGMVYVGLTSQVQKLDAQGAPIASWGKEGKGTGELAWITSIAVTESDVYVADADNRCVHRFDLTGDFIGDLGRRTDNSVGLVLPSRHLDCVVDADRNVVVTNTGLRHIETYSPDGRLLGFWGESSMLPAGFSGCCNPTNVALTRDGNIVTAEKGIPRVKVHDRSGKMLAFIGPEHFSADAAGMDLAVDARDRIYVADPVAGVIRLFAPVGKGK